MSEWLPIISLVVAIGVAIFVLVTRKTPLTATNVTASLESVMPLATQLAEVALTGAQAAEQLYLTGKITKGERLDKAFDYVRTFFPDVDQNTIVTAIEAGVLVVNTIVESMPKKLNN